MGRAVPEVGRNCVRMGRVRIVLLVHDDAVVRASTTMYRAAKDRPCIGCDLFGGGLTMSGAREQGDALLHKISCVPRAWLCGAIRMDGRQQLFV